MREGDRDGAVVAQAWRLLDQSDAPADGATNMATDAALLDAVKDGGRPVVRLYRWDPATLSFGRNQPTRGRYDEGAAAARGIDFVRRPTGGQAVLHDHELTYAVVAPVAVIGKPRAAYGGINRALVDGLGRLGVRAGLSEGGGLGSGGGSGSRGVGSGFVAEDDGGAAGQGSSVDWDLACFRRPERGEVVAGGAKLVGSAQRMEDRVILQHGSILVGGSQAVAEELVSGTPPGTPTPTTTSGSDPGWTTLDRELGARPSFGELVEAVVAGFEAVLGVALEPSSLTAAERARGDALRDHFASGEWTWRR